MIFLVVYISSYIITIIHSLPLILKYVKKKKKKTKCKINSVNVNLHSYLYSKLVNLHNYI